MNRRAGLLVFASALFATASRAEKPIVVDGMIVAPPPPFVAVTGGSDRGAEVSSGDYHPGIGRSWPASGRFGGRGHSDGVLDWDVPKFGRIEKGHLAAHPANASRRAWAINFAPPGTTVAATGDEYRVRWLSTEWRARFGPVEISMTYSLASPGLLIETAAPALRFDLSETPGYRFAVLPLRRGVTVRSLRADRAVYDRNTDGELADNWVLLWGSVAFPDVPVLLVLRSSPLTITPSFGPGRTGASALTVTAADAIGHLVLATPWGMEAMAPERTAELNQLADGVARSQFWSKALLGFILDGGEDYHVDEPAGTVAIRQHFVYRDLNDAWGSRPRHLAPLPPACVLAAHATGAAGLPANVADLRLATRHGPLVAALDRDESRYVLPIPPADSHTPLASTDNSPARELVRARHTPQPHDGRRPLRAEEFPGFWTRPDRNAIDVVASANEMAFLWPQLAPEARQVLKSNWRSLLLDCLDDQDAFRQTELFRSIVRTPGREEAKLTRPIWFERTEPATQSSYRLSYTVPNVRKEGRSITDYPGSFTDCEWGNGLALWGIFQLARVSGDWEAVRRNWTLINGIYALFRVQQDWAVMTASGSERGRRWVDTSCYGGYVAYRQMARRAGTEQERLEAIYLHAKHAALRLALLEFGVWSHELYGVRPFRVAHMMQEHNRGFSNPLEPLQYVVPADFQGEPIAMARRTLYSLVAEGTGWECPDLLYSLAPGIAAEIVRDYPRSFPDWCSPAFVEAMNKAHSPSGGITLYELFLCQLRDPTLSTSELRRQFAQAGGAEAIRRYLSDRGHYGRFGAAPEYTFALLETRDDPGWLADWDGELLAADFDRATQEARFHFTTADWQLVLGGRAPASVRAEDDSGTLDCRRERNHWIVRGSRPALIRVRY